MKHWIKRALTTAALASGVMILSAGAASAAPEGKVPLDPLGIISQTQQATNENSTTQDAESTAETHQVNVYAPVAVLSPGSNNGDVEQSNEAETTAVAVNDNDSEQSIEQDQAAGAGSSCGKCGSDGGSSQSQQAENNNTTDQDSSANAETRQVNVYAPVAVLSPGSNNGDVDQSNKAETTAVAVNDNDSKQSIDQDQTAESRDGKDSCGKCGSGGNVEQTQDAANNNTTDQDASANAATNQSNQIGNQPEKSPAYGSKEGYADHRKGDDGDVDQSNKAETTAVAVNDNDSKQSIDQDQTAESRDGKGWRYEPRDRGGKDDHGKSHDKDKEHKPHRGDKDDHGKSHDKDSCDRPDKGKSSGETSQSQQAGNNNTTSQSADADARTDQTNLYAPVASKSHGSNGGDVDQSNQAKTTALAGNGNSSGQAIWQSMQAL